MIAFDFVLSKCTFSSEKIFQTAARSEGSEDYYHMCFFPAQFPYKKNKSLPSKFPFSSSSMKENLQHIHMNLINFLFPVFCWAHPSPLTNPLYICVLPSSFHPLKLCTPIFSKPFIPFSSHSASPFKQGIWESRRRQEGKLGKLEIIHTHSCSKRAKFSFGLEWEMSADTIKLTLI